ncbi:MAG: hypothetical protein J6N54_08590 [Bacteroidales bacterium]|nr:hypothetical protein [Bacteroidales bacterium]
METGKDILEKVGKPSLEIPAGYFDSLKDRLGSIPTSEAPRQGVLRQVRPYLALAASFAAILLIGNAVLSGTVGLDNPQNLDIDEPTYADFISLARPDIVVNAIESQSEGDEISDEDIINYLIESGVNPEHLAYAGDTRQ